MSLRRVRFLRFFYALSLAGALVLGGCSTRYYSAGTPVIKKHAKRGYNKSYKIKGTRYHPRPQYEYSQKGKASYYGGRDVFHGRKTSTGERFDKNGMTAAHKTLPLPSVVRVTNLKNGRSIKLRINDRGPFVKGRIIDVSEKASKLLGFHHDGVVDVRVECLVSESMMLARNYNPNNCNPYTVHGHRGHDHGLTLKQAMGNTLKRVARRPVSRPIFNKPAIKMTHPPLKPRRFKTYSTANINTTLGLLAKGNYIQVGTYSSQLNAQNFAHKVAARMRVPCQSLSVNEGGKSYHRVLMGPMKSQEATIKMIHELDIRNVKDAFVVVQK